MNKRQAKSQASSSRAAAAGSNAGFGGVFGSVSAAGGSSLSYLTPPPDLTPISDPSVVIAFKNLLKKDAITRTRGLEDLRAYVRTHPYVQDNGVEDPILETWVKLYPRISFDNSRRVRELAHALQFDLMKSAGKRMEKFIPSIVGAWLAGTYDRDLSVSKAATDGITSFLTTEEKVRMFWYRCQTDILDFAQGAIEETRETLSDERMVNADDSQATYDRVVGGSLSLVVNLLIKLSPEDISKNRDAYARFLVGNKRLWTFVASKDPFVRRITAQLLFVCLDIHPGFIEQDLRPVASAFINEGLMTRQSNSSLAYLQALDKLTKIFPTVWTTSYIGKEPPLSRLSHFITTGSEAGPAEYWIILNSLITKLPSGVLPVDLAGAIDFLKAFTKGVTSREEARGNIGTAWICYINVVRHLQSALPDPKDKCEVLVAGVYPMFEDFVHPTGESTRWWMSDTHAALAKAFHICFLSETYDSKFMEPNNTIRREWKRLAEKIATSMDVALPISPIDLQESQTSIAAETQRWFALQAEIIRYPGAEKSDDQNYKDILIEASSAIITSAIQVLVATNGKAYGAAAAIEGALRLAPAIISDAPSIIEAIVSFLTDQLPKLVVSPSSSYLIQSLKHMCNFPGQQTVGSSIWESTINELVTLPDDEKKAVAAEALISSRVTSKAARENTKLQELLAVAGMKALHEGREDWRRLCESGIKFNCFSNETLDMSFNNIVDALSHERGPFKNALLALEYMVGNRPELFECEDARHIIIMTRLLAASESEDIGMATRASILRNAISDVQAASTTTAPKHSPIVAIIQESLEMSGPRLLTIDTLVTQAVAIVGSLGLQPVADLFPNYKDWQKNLAQVFNEHMGYSLALTNLLGGAVALVPFKKAFFLPAGPVRRDADGYSAAFRMALYTSQLITHKEVIEYVPSDTQADIIYMTSLSVAKALDQLSLHMEGWLWSSLADPAVENKIQDFISSSRRSLTKLVIETKDWREPSPSGQSQVAQKMVLRLIKGSSGRSTLAFYNGRLLSDFLSNIVECHGWRASGGDEWLASFDVLKPSTPNVFTALGFLRGLKDHLGSSNLINNLCNRLVSDISGASAKNDETLPLLLLMNAVLDVYEHGSLPVAHNRLVFAVKQITSWMDECEEDLNPPMASESCRSLHLLFSDIKDVYGPYWKSAIQFCVSLWTSDRVMKDTDDWLPAIHSSLKLIVMLKGLNEPNEDLEEALNSSEKLISEGILHLLALNRPQIEDQPWHIVDQPWHIVDELIARQATTIPLKHVGNLTELYPLLASGSSVIQTAAFEILHRALPIAQEEISVDVLLEKKEAKLPEELLSLLLDAPQMQDFPSDVLSQLPPPIRTYLFAWQLIYNSFSTAPHKVRSDYTLQLKSENVISHLLDFLFDVLGHSAGKPLNLERARITTEYIRSYDIESANTIPDEYNFRWLLINIYYLCLKYTPGLAKNWYVDCKSKQTRLAVEGWTEKYFSPLVIADTLDDVAKWAEEQEAPPEDEKPLIVKVSKKSKEVSASYEVDEMMMQIVIRLLPMYPLEGIRVEGLNRVAVSEKKWQSWLMITQGVITFSNGSITDGLLAFRRNVTGALKGQTECAICYSIVSSDKKMPDKRCQTCKHLFHSSCLFKWFASSNQSTCPLCRNPFNYGSDSDRRARRRGGPEE